MDVFWHVVFRRPNITTSLLNTYSKLAPGVICSFQIIEKRVTYDQEVGGK